LHAASGSQEEITENFCPRWDTPVTPEDIPSEEDLAKHPPPADV